MTFGQVHEPVAVPVNGIFFKGSPFGQSNRHLDPASVQFSVAGHTF
jgi:hypothetical protein